VAEAFECLGFLFVETGWLYFLFQLVQMGFGVIVSGSILPKDRGGYLIDPHIGTLR